MWLDALAADRGATARTLQIYRDDLAAAVLQLTADTQLERLTARYDPKRSLGKEAQLPVRDEAVWKRRCGLKV